VNDRKDAESVFFGSSVDAIFDVENPKEVGADAAVRGLRTPSPEEASTDPPDRLRRQRARFAWSVEPKQGWSEQRRASCTTPDRRRRERTSKGNQAHGRIGCRRSATAGDTTDSSVEQGPEVGCTGSLTANYRRLVLRVGTVWQPAARWGWGRRALLRQ
jgi:hypothetical protein